MHQFETTTLVVSANLVVLSGDFIEVATTVLSALAAVAGF